MSIGSFASKFVKNIASPLERLANDVVNKVVSGLPGNATQVANDITKSLFDIGASYDSVQAIASLKTDNVVSKGAADYYALAGKAPGRASASSISAGRRASMNKASFTTSNPNIKISDAEKKAAATVTAIR